MTNDVKKGLSPPQQIQTMIYVFLHLVNAIFVISKQIAAASLEMNSIDFPLGSFWFSHSEGYYLIRSEEGSVRYLPCLRLTLALP